MNLVAANRPSHSKLTNEALPRTQDHLLLAEPRRLSLRLSLTARP